MRRNTHKRFLINVANDEGIIVMNPKETVFSSRDLLHSIMDFLPGKEPISVRIVSRDWLNCMCEYKLINMIFDFQKRHEEFYYRTTLIPSHINFDPKNIIESPYLVRKILFSSSSVFFNYGYDIFSRFQNLFELRIGSFNLPANLCNLPVSLRKLKISQYGRDHAEITHYFDGINLSNLISLDLSEIDCISCVSILPPNLEKLLMPRKCGPFAFGEPFPISLKTLIYQHIEGKTLPGTIPENLEHLEIRSGFMGDSELILPPNITHLDLGKDCVFPSNTIRMRKLRTFYTNEITTEWNPYLTKIKLYNKHSLQLTKFNMFPPTLTELEYNAGPYCPFITENLPYSVLSLTLHVENNYCPVFRKSPPCLRSLTLRERGNIFLLENDLPESITSLKIIDDSLFSILGKLIFPPNLQYLSLQCIIERIEVALPRSLTFLDIPMYHHSFDKGILPDSLTTLNLNANYRNNNLSISWFPESLDFVNIGGIRCAFRSLHDRVIMNLRKAFGRAF
jgi:hypothetical protein